MSAQPVKIIRTTNTVRVLMARSMKLQFVPFTFTATDGQTEFTLPSTPYGDGLFICSINGSPQDQEGGDFSVATNILTLAEGVDLNDKVYGFYEKR